MRHHRVCKARGNVVLDRRMQGLGGATRTPVWAAVGECVVELGLYSHCGAQRVAVGLLVRSAHIQEIKAMMAYGGQTV